MEERADTKAQREKKEARVKAIFEEIIDETMLKDPMYFK